MVALCRLMLVTSNSTNIRHEGDENGEHEPNRYYLDAVRNARLLPVPMPTCLNFRDRGSNLQTDGTNVSYIPSISNVDEPCLVRANHFIPPACGLFYFEVLVVAAPSSLPSMAIGICTRGAHKDGFLPGQEKHSTSSQQQAIVITYGYESTRGDRLNGSVVGEQYGPSWTQGDVVGCCVDYLNDRIHFTKNGTHLGVAFQNVGLGEGSRNLFPCVGLSELGQSVEVNFGRKPFRYDLASLVNECKESARLDILRQTSQIDRFDVLMNQIILCYLRHHGYADTASRFAREVNGGAERGEEQEENRDVRNRKQILHSILTGHTDNAIQLLETYYPGLLSLRTDILFAIKCQTFVDMVRASLLPQSQQQLDIHSCTEVISYGRKELVPLMHLLSSTSFNHMGDEQMEDARLERRLEKQKCHLRDVFSLLAYNNPCQSPVSHLLLDERRDELACKVNRAILKYLDKEKKTPMDIIARQGQVAIELLITTSQSPTTSFLSLDDFI